MVSHELYFKKYDCKIPIFKAYWKKGKEQIKVDRTMDNQIITHEVEKLKKEIKYNTCVIMTVIEDQSNNDFKIGNISYIPIRMDINLKKYYGSLWSYAKKYITNYGYRLEFYKLKEDGNTKELRIDYIFLLNIK